MAGRIVVVDYHKGNLLSVVRSLVDVGADAVISDEPAVISGASAVVLPGVGSLEDAMDYMRASGQDEAVCDSIARGVPFLGICLGQHLLMERGDERTHEHAPDDVWCPGLGVIPGSARRLDGGRLKVPHVGWDQIHLTEAGRACLLFAGVAEGANMYFTHSYALDDDVAPNLVAARTHYTRSFASAIWRDNVYAVQFHPEKSSVEGLKILSNFVGIVNGSLA